MITQEMLDATGVSKETFDNALQATTDKGTVSIENVGIITGRVKGNFPPGAEAGASTSVSTAKFASRGSTDDWRVRISFPNSSVFTSSTVLRPLLATDGLVFPYTPTVNIGHSANYTLMEPMHNNYPFLSYQNSKVDEIQIQGDFIVEDAKQATYWVATVHFLRSLTKMSYGDTSNTGSPPPVVKLSGYGPHVFNNTPIVIKSFQVQLMPDVDYMSCEVDSMINRVPVKSTVSVTAALAYSREQVRRFSLDDFVKGNTVGSYI
jgi:hypothetical protein